MPDCSVTGSTAQSY